jgi:ABC-type Mn2+/Zn2+ transport system ATPase subunit
MKAVEVKDLNVFIGEAHVLKDVSFELNHPSVLVIVGPNGAGKTTLLKTILGFIKRSSGIIKVFNTDPEKDPGRIRNLVSYMPQIHNIDPFIPLKVREIVSTPVFFGESDHDLVDKALQITGLEEYADRYFYELSGGLRQRVLVARALAKKADLLIFDEPLSMVDIGSREHIIDLLMNIVRKESISMIVVSHDVSHCIKYDPYILLLNKTVIGFGKAREVFTLENLAKIYGAATLNGKIFFMGEEHGSSVR